MSRDQMMKARAEVIGQMAQAMAGIGTEAVVMMATEGAPDLVVGMGVGERAGRVAECMAKANTARRVRDTDGYRRALRRAAALILGALVEIGEEPNEIDAENMRRRREAVRFEDTDVGREYAAARSRDRSERNRLASGTGDEIEA